MSATDLSDLRIELLAIATQMAMANSQMVGAKNDYYVTIRQLELLLRGLKSKE